ncbi:glycosyltransferase family 1 protein [Bacillus sp. JJ1773]|uniref:glycosyltransferase family 4 protein n=1 Tax=Bacillus sp. JJ1773 TaxID=3122965 RepID=UPI00300069F8
MKIAFFTDTFYPEINGVARTLKQFTDYLTRENISFKVFAPSTLSSEYLTPYIHRFKSLPFFLYPECRFAFPNPFQMREELIHFAPDIIHVATPFNLGVCGAYYAKKLNIPLVGSYHTDFDYYLQYYDLPNLSKYLWKYMNWFHRPLQKIYVPSSESIGKLRKRGFTNMEVWSRGVDCKLFHPYYDKLVVRKRYQIRKKYLLIYVGRLAPEKDVNTLLEIAKALPPYINENLHWLIVGDGPSRAQLQNAALENMDFTGFLQGKELAEIYSAADLFVFPSPTETFGNVVLESFASGTPVIGANSGGVKCIIQEGVTGRLCPPGNVPQFTKAVIELLYDHSLRSQMGIEGRKYAFEQKWDTIFEKLLKSYSTTIDKENKQELA